MITSELDWANAAACRGVDRALFYSLDLNESREERLERERGAKRICSGCSVREECLRVALDQRESYGIWGGLNELERRALRRV